MLKHHNIFCIVSCFIIRYVYVQFYFVLGFKNNITGGRKNFDGFDNITLSASSPIGDNYSEASAYVSIFGNKHLVSRFFGSKAKELKSKTVDVASAAVATFQTEQKKSNSEVGSPLISACKRKRMKP